MSGRPATAPVSVVVPAYGHADYIVASIESALSQQPPPREIIVVDDGSPDDTRERLASLIQDDRIRYIRQANAGMAAARNAGAALATSEYLYFLDDDDFMYPGAMAWLVEELEQHPDAAMVFGSLVRFTESIPPKPPTWSESASVDPTRFMLYNHLGSPGQVLIRRSAFNTVGGFDPTIWGTDDWDLWLRLLERYPARTARRPVLAYRVHAMNASRNWARMYESSLRVAKQHLPNFPRRAVVQRFTYGSLRFIHVDKLERMAVTAVREREWQMAASAVITWVRAWLYDLWAAIMLKLHLLRHGRWQLSQDDPLHPLVRARE